MSVGTLIVIVLSVSMLILGIVLVRSIMCGAIGLTGDVNDKVRGELESLFGSSAGEVACIGAETAKMFPGETNNIYCAYKAKEQAKYDFNIVSYSSDTASITEEKMTEWAIIKSSSYTISPGDVKPNKVATFKIPDTASEGTMFISIEVLKDGGQIFTQRLDFEISRKGFVQNTIC